MNNIIHNLSTTEIITVICFFLGILSTALIYLHKRISKLELDNATIKANQSNQNDKLERIESTVEKVYDILLAK